MKAGSGFQHQYLFVVFPCIFSLVSSTNPPYMKVEVFTGGENDDDVLLDFGVL